MFEYHKRQIDWWKDKLGIDWYGVAWISFFKGFTLGFLLAYFLL